MLLAAALPVSGLLLAGIGFAGLASSVTADAAGAYYKSSWCHRGILLYNRMDRTLPLGKFFAILAVVRLSG